MFFLIDFARPGNLSRLQPTSKYPTDRYRPLAPSFGRLLFTKYAPTASSRWRGMRRSSSSQASLLTGRHMPIMCRDRSILLKLCTSPRGDLKSNSGLLTSVCKPLSAQHGAMMTSSPLPIGTCARHAFVFLLRPSQSSLQRSGSMVNSWCSGRQVDCTFEGGCPTADTLGVCGTSRY